MNKGNNKIALFLCILGFFFWAILLSYKYFYFGYYDWDFALYAHTMYGLSNGSVYSSLYGTSFLADHTHYIAFFLAPMYKLLPHPMTLIYLELFSFFGGAFILYKIAEKRIGLIASLTLMLLFIIHPANVFMLFYEFHFESLAIGLIFLLFYFMFEKRWVAFMVTAVITMSVKENMSLVVFMFGLYGLLTSKMDRLRWGVIPLLIGGTFFVVNLFILMPLLRNASHNHNSMYLGLYSHLNSLGGLWHQIFSSLNFHYLKELFLPFLFLPIYQPLVSLMASPILAQNMLASTESMHTIYYHYAATIVPFIAVALIGALVFIRNNCRAFTYNIICFLIIFSSIMSVSQYWSTWKGKIFSWPDGKDNFRQHLIDSIPSNASVIASFDFLSHLCNRQEVYPFYNVFKGTNYFTGDKPAKIPMTVEYALIDFNDPWLVADLKKNPLQVKERVDHFLNTRFIVKEKMGSIVLFQKK